MKKILFVILICMQPLLVISADKEAKTEGVFTVDACSAYVWRGITYNDGFVVQPALIFTKRGFGIQTIGTVDLNEYENEIKKNDLSRIDVVASYSKSDFLGGELKMGFNEYFFPNHNELQPGTNTVDTNRVGVLELNRDETHEMFARLKYFLAGDMYCQVEANYDFDEFEGVYARVALGIQHDFESKYAGIVEVSSGYADKKWAPLGKAGLFDWQVRTKLVAVNKEMCDVSISLAYTDSFDADVLPEQDVNFYGGFGVAIEF